MPSAKEIQIRLIKKHAAAAIIQKYHYSGKATQNSQLNFGVFINDKLEGAFFSATNRNHDLSFGPIEKKSEARRERGALINDHKKYEIHSVNLISD
jgi:hypothetical protein